MFNHPEEPIDVNDHVGTLKKLYGIVLTMGRRHSREGGLFFPVSRESICAVMVKATPDAKPEKAVLIAQTQGGTQCLCYAPSFDGKKVEMLFDVPRSLVQAEGGDLPAPPTKELINEITHQSQKAALLSYPH